MVPHCWLAALRGGGGSPLKGPDPTVSEPPSGRTVMTRRASSMGNGTRILELCLEANSPVSEQRYP